MRTKRLRLRNERGMVLPLALGILSVLSVSVVVVVSYTSTNARSSDRSRGDKVAFSLAEAGMNNAFSVLNNPTNNALDPDILPSRTTYYEGGHVVWSGVLDRPTAIWKITATGYTRNSSAASSTAQLQRTLSAKVVVVPTLTQPLNNPAWNYIYSTRTGNTCDQTLNNNVSGSSRMYIEGNLCLGNNAVVSQTSLIVKGNVDLANGNTAVGANTSMSTRVETYVGGDCRYGGGSWAACSGDQDSRRIYSKLSDGSTIGVSHTPPVVAAPAADHATWYENAIPGPSQSCTTSSGTSPTFDNDYPTRNRSVSTSFELTPASSYTCRVGPAADPSGELSWNATTKTLTVFGTMYIDGDVKLTNNSLNQYNGQATLYISGSFYMNGKLCGGVSGSSCDFSAWNPNTEMFTIVADGTGGNSGLVATGNTISLANGSQFQGGFFATGAIELGQNAKSDGPMMGANMIFNNNVSNDSFPTITTVPVGMPGNPAVYAQPNPPQMFAG